MSTKRKRTKSKSVKKRSTKKPPPTTKATRALAAFWDDARHTVKLPAAVGGLILKSDDNLKSDAEQRIQAGEPPTLVIDTILHEHSVIEPHIGTLYEMILCRLADNFLTFIAEILVEIYSNHPHLLVLSNIKLQLTADNVFSADSIDELRGRVIEQHVRSFAYENFTKFVKKLADTNQLDFKLFGTKDAITFASDLFEVRNLLVHNRGVVNHTFLDRVRMFRNVELGQRPNVDAKYLNGVMEFVLDSAITINKRAVKKFKLETPVTIKHKPRSRIGAR